MLRTLASMLAMLCALPAAAQPPLAATGISATDVQTFLNALPRLPRQMRAQGFRCAVTSGDVELASAMRDEMGLSEEDLGFQMMALIRTTLIERDKTMGLTPALATRQVDGRADATRTSPGSTPIRRESRPRLGP